MTHNSPETETAEPAEPADKDAKASLPKPDRRQAAMPVLEELFRLYPHLFGAEFQPLKLGVFQEILARNPDSFTREGLKTALAVHTRSTRYLQCVAAGKMRHDLDGQAVQEVAPEHVYQALVELFRRRQLRSPQDLSAKLRAQLMTAFESSGLSRQEYLLRVQPNDEKTTALLEEALEASTQKTARHEALRRAYESSGQSLEDFAEMYGVPRHEVQAALKRQAAAD